MHINTQISVHTWCVCKIPFLTITIKLQNGVPRGSQRLSTMPKGWCLHMKRRMKLTLDLNLLQILNSVPFFLPLNLVKIFNFFSSWRNAASLSLPSNFRPPFSLWAKRSCRTYLPFLPGPEEKGCPLSLLSLGLGPGWSCLGSTEFGQGLFPLHGPAPENMQNVDLYQTFK